MRSQPQDGSLLLIQKQHVASLTGKATFIIDFLCFFFKAIYSVLDILNNQMITNVSIFLAVVQYP